MKNRLDILVAAQLGISRSLAQKIIKNNFVFINGEISNTPDKKVLEYEKIEILPEFRSQIISQTFETVPQDIPLEVLYEDARVLVINKQPGMSVHTSMTEREGTVLNALLYRYSGIKSMFSAVERPGIVHRLDKETSGVLIIAKDPEAQYFLSKQFQERQTKKEYHAIVSGKILHPQTIEKAIARNKKERKKMGIDPLGREAITSIEPIAYFKKDLHHAYTYMHAFPKTGRTHQIRVHLKSIGHAIVGDSIYNGEKDVHMYLHAAFLTISIPDKGVMTFHAPDPDYFDEFLAHLTKE